MVRSIIEGLRQGWKRRSIFILLWLANLGWAVLFLNPYLQTFKKFFAHRLVTDVLARSSIYTYYAEFYYYMKDGVVAAQKALSAANLVFALLMFLASSGIVDAFVEQENFGIRRFLSRSGEFAGRMLRLGVLGVGLGIALLLTGLIPSLPFFLWIAASPTETTIFPVVGAVVLIYLLLFTAGLLLMDLSRLYLVRDNLLRVRAAFGKAWRYFRKHWFRLLLLYGMLGVMVLGFLGISNYFLLHLPDTSTEWYLISFMMLQVIIFLKIWLKYSRFGALVSFQNRMEER